MNGIVVTKGISREFDCTPQVRYKIAVPEEKVLRDKPYIFGVYRSYLMISIK